MQAAPGHYSLIQYSPDPSRLEAVNVGVVLHSGQTGELVYRMIDGVRRLRRFFGPVDEDQIALERQALDQRLQGGLDDFPSSEDLDRFAATRSGLLRLTPPRPVRVVSAADEIEALFERLVGTDAAPRKRVGEARRRFDQALVARGLAASVSRSIHVELVELKRRFTAPYAYRNGRLNLIEPVNFMSAASAFDTACRRAVEGRALSRMKHPQFGCMNLIVVAHFSPEGRTREDEVRATLLEHCVQCYDVEAVEPLLEDIRSHAALPLG